MRKRLIGGLALGTLMMVACSKPPEATQAVQTSEAATQPEPMAMAAPSGRNAPASAQQKAATLPPGVNRDHP